MGGQPRLRFGAMDRQLDRATPKPPAQRGDDRAAGAVQHEMTKRRQVRQRLGIQSIRVVQLQGVHALMLLQS